MVDNTLGNDKTKEVIQNKKIKTSKVIFFTFLVRKKNKILFCSDMILPIFCVNSFYCLRKSVFFEIFFNFDT